MEGEQVEDGAFMKAYQSIMDNVKNTELGFPDDSVLRYSTSSKAVAAPVVPSKKLTESDISHLKQLKTTHELKVCVIPTFRRTRAI